MDNHDLPNNAANDLVDYAAGAFIKTYEEDGCLFYAAFHPELYLDEEGLDGTGRYFVVLLAPSGMQQLYMVKREGKWVPDSADKNLQEVDSLLDNVLDEGNAHGKNYLEEKNDIMDISQQRIDWISGCILQQLI